MLTDDPVRRHSNPLSARQFPSRFVRDDAAHRSEVFFPFSFPVTRHVGKNHVSPMGEFPAGKKAVQSGCDVSPETRFDWTSQARRTDSSQHRTLWGSFRSPFSLTLFVSLLCLSVSLFVPYPHIGRPVQNDAVSALPRATEFGGDCPAGARCYEAVHPYMELPPPPNPSAATLRHSYTFAPRHRRTLIGLSVGRILRRNTGFACLECGGCVLEGSW